MPNLPQIFCLIQKTISQNLTPTIVNVNTIAKLHFDA